MHRAASTGNSELCEFLIEEGAEVDAVDKAGQTPLMNAVICENKEVILVIIFYFNSLFLVSLLLDKNLFLSSVSPRWLYMASSSS